MRTQGLPGGSSPRKKVKRELLINEENKIMIPTGKKKEKEKRRRPQTSKNIF